MALRLDLCILASGSKDAVVAVGKSKLRSRLTVVGVKSKRDPGDVGD